MSKPNSTSDVVDNGFELTSIETTLPLFGGYGYTYRPANLYEGSYSVTVDLNEMTLKVKAIEGSGKSCFSMVEDGGSDEETTVMYPSPSNPDVLVSSKSVTEPTVINFYLDGDDSVIVPDGSGLVEFDETGYWTGSFTRNAPQRSSRRRAASKSTDWCIQLDEPTELSILVDEAKSTITVISSAHNQGYFVATLSSEVKVGEKPAALVETEKGSGIYSGVVNIAPKDGKCDFIVCKTLVAGVSGYSYSDYEGPRYDSQSTFSGYDTSAQTLPSYGCIGGGRWSVESDYVGVVQVTLNTVDYTLTLDATTLTGVENVVVAKSLSVVPVYGGVKITSDYATDLTIYSITGAIVKVVKVVEGTTIVDLPAGIYIAAGTKLAVR